MLSVERGLSAKSTIITKTLISATISQRVYTEKDGSQDIRIKFCHSVVNIHICEMCENTPDNHEGGTSSSHTNPLGTYILHSLTHCIVSPWIRMQCKLQTTHGDFKFCSLGHACVIPSAVVHVKLHMGTCRYSLE